MRPRALTCPEAFDHPPVPHHVTVKRSRNKRSTLYYHDTEINTSSFERPTLKKEDLPNVKVRSDDPLRRFPLRTIRSYLAAGSFRLDTNTCRCAQGQLPSFDWQTRMSSPTGNWYYVNAKLGANSSGSGLSGSRFDRRLKPPLGLLRWQRFQIYFQLSSGCLSGIRCVVHHERADAWLFGLP